MKKIREMRINFLYLFFAIVLFTSCHEDVIDDDLTSVTEAQITVPYTFVEIEGTLIGYVFGEDGQPIIDASVSIYSGTTSTNEYGVFQFPNTKLDGQGTLVVVSKPGYLDGSDFVYPNDEGSGTARVRLDRFLLQETFNGSDGGVVPFADNGQVIFPSNTIVDQSGSSYSGTVESDVSNVYPNDLTFNDQHHGGFIGTDKEGSNTVLGALGIVNILLQSVNDEPLKIKSEESFTISFPIDPSQSMFAKSEVDVWKYDTSTGYWLEVGSAQKDGSFYRIEVSELGSYMFAEGYGLTHYCIRLVDEGDMPIKNYNYKVFIDGKICAKGISDNDGFICSKLPIYESLELNIYRPLCDEVVKSIDLDPLDEPNNGGDIEIETSLDIISGTVECNGSSVSNAVVIIKSANGVMLQTTNDAGVFIINADDATCTSSETFEVVAMLGEEFSSVLELGTNAVSDIELDVCQTECEFVISFLFSKTEVCLSGAYDDVRVMVDGGSGQYSYLWNDGSQEVTNTNIVTGSEACVTVTDLSSGCSVDYCEQVADYRSLELLVINSYNSSCTQNGGVIEMDVIGGKIPYEYRWESDNGYTSNIANPSNLWPGIYYITITDENECEVSSEIEIYDVTTPINSETIEGCDFSTITIVEEPGNGPFSYLWEWEGGSSTFSYIDIFIPGEYKVTRTDQDNCSRTKSFTISNVGTEINLNYNYSCNEGSVFYNVLNVGYDYFYEAIESSERYSLIEDGGIVEISILESGYRYYFGAEDLNIGCEVKEIIELPHFEGLLIEDIEDTSCGVCTDGVINVSIDTNQDCSGGCVVGEIIIISKLTGTDVTTLNEENQLSAGDYVVIVLDENTGCYIAHEEVTIE